MSQIADTDAAGCALVVDIGIDSGVSSWSVTDYKTRCVEIFDALGFLEMFSYGVNSFMFDRRNGRLDTDISTWARRQAFLRRWCPDTLKVVLRFDMSIVRHAQEMNHFRCLTRIVRIVNVASE